MKKFIADFLWAILWGIFVFILCTMNPSAFPQIKVAWSIGPDKFVHAILFGVQAYLLANPIFKRSTQHPGKLIVLMCLLGAMYGIVIEVLQATVFTLRTFDYDDMVANTVGALVALMIEILRLNHTKRLGKNYQKDQTSKKLGHSGT